MIRFGFASVREHKWHYAASGPSEGPLILFLHGFPALWRCWQSQLEGLGADYLCVAPDLPGYNLSSKPKEAVRYRIKNLIADVEAFAGAFTRKRKFILVGHDWGGALAWAFAIRHPELLERLIIINAVHPGAFQRELIANPAQGAASQYIHALRAPDAEKKYAADDYALLARSLSALVQKEKMSAAELEYYKAAWAEPGALTGMFNWYRAMRISPPGETATEAAFNDEELMVRVRTLVLWGLRDEALLPGCVEGLERWVPEITVKTFAGAGHWLALEEPHAVNREIADWLKE